MRPSLQDGNEVIWFVKQESGMEVAAFHSFPAIGRWMSFCSRACNKTDAAVAKASCPATRRCVPNNCKPKRHMTRSSGSNLDSALTQLLAARPDPQRPLEAALVYEDLVTREWATEAHARLEQGAGRRNLRSTWWKVGDFSHPGVLAGAVSKAMQAEVIVVAVQGSEGLPLPFYFWVNAWLPHHLMGNGLLLGMVWPVNPRQPESGRVQEYLRSIARQGRFRLFLEERRLKQPPRFSRPVLRFARSNLSRV